MPEKDIHIFCDPSLLSRGKVLHKYSALRKLARLGTVPDIFVFISSHELVNIRPRGNRHEFSLIKLEDPKFSSTPLSDPFPIRKALDKDRRLKPRVMLRRPITYEIRVLPEARHHLMGKHLRGALMNMSDGGVGLKTKHRLQANMIVSLRLPVNKMFVAVPTLAKVLWVAMGPKRNEVRAGLKFII